MRTSISRSDLDNARVSRIQDAIGYNGIDAFVQRALALGRGVVDKVDEGSAARFASLFLGGYSPAIGRQCDDRLRHICLPSGYVNVHVHDAYTGRLLVGIYQSGCQPVRAVSVAAAIGIQECVFHGATVQTAVHKKSELPGVLEIALGFAG